MEQPTPSLPPASSSSTPPSPDSDNSLPLMSVAEIEDISRKNFENKQAQLRGESPPHPLTQQELVRCLQSLRSMRGAVEPKAAKKAGGKTAVTNLNVDAL